MIIAALINTAITLLIYTLMASGVVADQFRQGLSVFAIGLSFLITFLLTFLAPIIKIPIWRRLLAIAFGVATLIGGSMLFRSSGFLVLEQ